MEKPQTIILYSKYSQHSKRLLDSLKSINIDWEKLINLQLLCIDNENIRKRILNSKDIQIKTVPCILIIYSDGVVEKFDGPNSFEWVENIINKHYQSPTPHIPNSSPNPEQPNPLQSPMQQSSNQPNPMQQSPNQPNHVSSNVQYETPTQSTVSNKQHKIRQKTNTKKSKFSNATSIDELVSEDEDEDNEIIENREDDSEDERVSTRRKPPMRIRTDAGNFEEIDIGNIENSQPPEAGNVSRHIKGTTAKEKTDIISKAQALEKARQAEESSSSRNKNIDFSRGT